jgi:predicted RNA-binding protein with PIN domain
MLIIDGHNLIPNVPGLSLQQIDDEEKLIELVLLYARKYGTHAEVFFDNAPIGHAGARSYGIINAHFIQSGKTADEAIVQFLNRLKKSARNASVVTSDRRVQAEARALGASTISSDEFAQELAVVQAEAASQARARSKPAAPKAPPKSEEGERNLDQWYDLFGIDPEQAEKPIATPRAKGKPGSPASKPPAAPGDGSARNPAGKPRTRHGFEKKK